MYRCNNQNDNLHALHCRLHPENLCKMYYYGPKLCLKRDQMWHKVLDILDTFLILRWLTLTPVWTSPKVFHFSDPFRNREMKMEQRAGSLT